MFRYRYPLLEAQLSSMMDAYSYIPGPSKEQAFQEIWCYFDHEKIQKSYYLEFILRKVIDEEHNKYGGLGSYTGWNVTTKKSIINKTNNKFNKTRAKVNLQKLRIIIKSIIWYNKFVTEYYKPDGLFVQKTKESDLWKK